MSNQSSSSNLHKVSVGGLLVALGIIYGDIGTSPLYVFKAIIDGRQINELLIIGGVSLIFWTLTIQTTIKYVLLTLKADNKGEGGIFSLYALVRRHAKWTVFFGMVGGAALLADGIITPPITVTSAIEGLRNIEVLQGITTRTIVEIVIAILIGLFVMQQFGAKSIGKLFGPIMFIWFTMLAVLGISHIVDDLAIFKAINPYYGINLLITNPSWFLILGAVFLCTTGAEALYSDLGHCGRGNIRMSWIYVKTCLILNYLGQGAYMLAQHKGTMFASDDYLKNAAFMAQNPAAKAMINPFFAIMPEWFVMFGIIIATMASIIASQALISGSFTLVSEAMRLNLWPKLKINYPTDMRGQLYIPSINWILLTGCLIVVIIFQESSRMEAAYGLSITLCMLMTSCLFGYYLYVHRVKTFYVALYLVVYLTIEMAFFAGNLVKFAHGGYITVLIGGALFMIMYVWFKARKIKNRYNEFVRMDQYIPILQELSNDSSIPKYATHLVYMTSANNPKEIEHKIMYSILNKKPKRADIYWFVHVDVLDEPYRTEYIVETIIPNEIVRVEFRLGFRVEQRISLMFRKVVEDMVNNKEVNINSRYESLSKNKVTGDWQFIVMEKFLSHDNDLPINERFIMNVYFLLKKISLSEEKGFGLDSSFVTTEKYPLVVAPVSNLNLKRVHH